MSEFTLIDAEYYNQSEVFFRTQSDCEPTKAYIVIFSSFTIGNTHSTVFDIRDLLEMFRKVNLDAFKLVLAKRFYVNRKYATEFMQLIEMREYLLKHNIPALYQYFINRENIK